jgi:hypothetical protein
MSCGYCCLGDKALNTFHPEERQGEFSQNDLIISSSIAGALSITCYITKSVETPRQRCKVTM